MADQWSGGQSGPTDGWNVNLPAVVGVVFVFLVGVIAWVIVASGDDDSIETGSSVDDTAPTSTVAPLPTLTTSPLPMPSTSIVVATVPIVTAAPAMVTSPLTAPPPAPTAAPAAPTNPPPTAAPTTAVPTTTVAPANGGDLGVAGHPMQRPPCDGGYITVLASAIGDQATDESMEAVLDDYSGANYLRTDQTCPSLTPAEDGAPIYVVYFGPFGTDTEACDARDDGPDDAYVRKLSNDLGPDHSVVCS